MDFEVAGSTELIPFVYILWAPRCYDLPIRRPVVWSAAPFTERPLLAAADSGDPNRHPVRVRNLGSVARDRRGILLHGGVCESNLVAVEKILNRNFEVARAVGDVGNLSRPRRRTAYSLWRHRE